MRTSGLDDAARAELERRLGEGAALDGSFASLWAIEDVLVPLRRVRGLATRASWLTGYLVALVARAFEEMDLDVTVDGARVATSAPAYAVDVAAALAKLLDPPRPFPWLIGVEADLEALGAAPAWGLATVLQNHAWAETAHAPIAEQPDRLERGIAWLTREHLRVAGLDGPAAEAVVRAMLWPPLGYPGNEAGEHNRPRLLEALAPLAGADAMTILDRLVAHPDRHVSLLAGWASVECCVPPDTRREAAVLREALTRFRPAVVPPVIEQRIGELLPWSLHVDAELAAAAELQRLEGADPDAALERALAAVREAPGDASRHLALAGIAERRGEAELAMSSYDRAVELGPRDWAARTGRGVLFSRAEQWEAADEDLLAALEARPDLPASRHNVLLNYFLADATRAIEALQTRKRELKQAVTLALRLTEAAADAAFVDPKATRGLERVYRAPTAAADDLSWLVTGEEVAWLSDGVRRHGRVRQAALADEYAGEGRAWIRRVGPAVVWLDWEAPGGATRRGVFVRCDGNDRSSEPLLGRFGGVCFGPTDLAELETTRRGARLTCGGQTWELTVPPTRWIRLACEDGTVVTLPRGAGDAFVTSRESPARRELTSWRVDEEARSAPVLLLPPSLARLRDRPAVGLRVTGFYGSLRRPELAVRDPKLFTFLMPPGGVQGGSVRLVARDASPLELFPTYFSDADREGIEPIALTIRGRPARGLRAVWSQTRPSGLVSSSVHVVTVLPATAEHGLGVHLSDHLDASQPDGLTPALRRALDGIEPVI
ncbi:MAG: tetratricopeptide repeat protein [Sandaracinaceae bacterium]|nr:tetratricopeptide repeat protein [Sandaracinaceae bacterium]